jgi:hypothetical protein
MAVPYTFGSATTSIPLSQLDSNFATAITLGNTAVQLGNTITNLTGVSNVASSGSLTLGTNGNTTAVTIDTSQNVGVGVTPSAWRTLYGTKVIQFGPVSNVYGLSASATNNRTSIGCNSYINSSGNTIYINSDYATEYQQTNGYHSFLTAPSGTTGGTASPVETLRISPTAAVILQGGNTSATGVGIAFPATQSASSDANTLDDYEEGTFTPTATASGAIAGFTYVSQVANYVKIGKTVYINLNIQISSLAGGSSGNLRIGNLPFTVSTTPTYGALAISFVEQTGGTAPNGAMATSTYINLYYNNGGSVTAVGFGSLSAFNYYIGGTYTTT